MKWVHFDGHQTFKRLFEGYFMVLGFRIGFRSGLGYGLGNELEWLQLVRSRAFAMIMKILTEVQGSVFMYVCEGCRSNCIQYCPYLCTQTDISHNNKGLFKMSGHKYRMWHMLMINKTSFSFIYNLYTSEVMWGATASTALSVIKKGQYRAAISPEFGLLGGCG